MKALDEEEPTQKESRDAKDKSRCECFAHLAHLLPLGLYLRSVWIVSHYQPRAAGVFSA
jgi:hypothetical protein